MTEQQENQNSTIYSLVKKLISLHFDNIKLTSAEKLTLLFAGVAFFAIVMVLTTIALIFVAIGISNLLEAYIAPFWTYFIIAGILFIAAAIVVVFKENIIVNPIARFISKLFVNPPKQQ